MMIPLSKDAKYEYKHPVSGIVYLLKYVTDAERIEFQKEQKNRYPTKFHPKIKTFLNR